MGSSNIYRSHVERLSEVKPTLNHLRQFLSMPDTAHRACRIVAMNFLEDGSFTSIHGDDGGLARMISDKVGEKPPQAENVTEKPQVCGDRGSTGRRSLRGQILIVEDLNKEIVEQLGTSLDIDPLFFAGHLHTSWNGLPGQTPDQCTLPSQAQRQGFVNIHYNRLALLDNVIPDTKKMLRRMNIDRKVVCRVEKCQQLAIIQHCTSVLLTRSSTHWIGLILVDRPIDGHYLYNTEMGAPLRPIYLHSSLFLGGYEEFLESPSLWQNWELRHGRSTQCGVLDDIIYYWSKGSPASFKRADPNLIGIAYYPLRIVAAEWIRYTAIMYRALKQYEYSTSLKCDVAQELQRLDVDMRALQRWRRRSLSSHHKVNAVVTILEKYQSAGASGDEPSLLLQDYKHLLSTIEVFGQRLESMLPFVASLVQIVDSRRSLGEAQNISRLTIVALLFVPLTFVSSLFSMSHELGPGGSLFWVYFVVAIPVTGAVFLFVKPPSGVWGLLWHPRRLRGAYSP